MVLCELRLYGGQPILTRIRDLSECGIKIASPRPLPAGTRVEIRMPGKEDWAPARVIWHARGLAGLAFAQAMDLPRVRGAESPPTPGPARWRPD